MTTEPFPYPLTAVVSVLVLVLNIWSGVSVGKARDRCKVPLPKTTGPVEFERAFRAHANNCEQYPMFLALKWIFVNISQNDKLAAGLGFAWVLARTLYVHEYHHGGVMQRVPYRPIWSIKSMQLVSWEWLSTKITFPRPELDRRSD